jgi:hypothetical protein
VPRRRQFSCSSAGHLRQYRADFNRSTEYFELRSGSPRPSRGGENGGAQHKKYTQCFLKNSQCFLKNSQCFSKNSQCFLKNSQCLLGEGCRLILKLSKKIVIFVAVSKLLLTFAADYRSACAGFARLSHFGTSQSWQVQVTLLSGECYIYK